MVVERDQFEAKKQRLIKKRRRQRAKRRLIIFVFLFVCTGIIFTVLKAPFFNIKTIICVGQNELTEEQIINIAGVKLNTNVFSTGVKAMKRRLAAQPAIAECNVRRLFPNKIKIWVREAKAAVYIETDKEFLHIDKNGQIIKITEKEKYEKVQGVAKLLDFEPASQVLGEGVIKKDDAVQQKIFECIGILERLEMIDKVTEISASDLSDIRIDYQDRLYILLGSYEQMEYKLTFVKKVISENISEYESALLDYRGKNLYVGSREEAVEDPETKEETGENVEDTAQNAAKETQDGTFETEETADRVEKIEET